MNTCICTCETYLGSGSQKYLWEHFKGLSANPGKTSKIIFI